MLELYKKMYATLMARVSEVLTDLINAILLEDCNKTKLLKIAQNLQQILQDVEEMYIEAEDLEENV